MYTIEKSFSASAYGRYRSKALDLYFENAKVGILDIETTGLTPDWSHFVLGGLLSFTENEATFKQYFVEDLAEERQVLSAYLAEAAKNDILITYNGKRFDFPFLHMRTSRLGLKEPNFPYNFDLYLVLNGFSQLRKFLPNLTQKTIENFMGLWQFRRDEISGRESAVLYQKYLVSKRNGTGTEGIIEKMLLHNSDDVLQLGRLLPVLEKTNLHNAMYCLGFPVAPLIVEKIAIGKNDLKISGKQSASSFDFIFYGSDQQDQRIEFDQRSKSFGISLPILRNSGLVLLDLTKLHVNLCNEVSIYPNFGDGYLVLQNRNNINYTEINYFIKLYLKKTIEKNFGGIDDVKKNENAYEAGRSL